jgi:hypothetical protein
MRDSLGITLAPLDADGQRVEDGSFDLDAEFTVFTTDDNPGGELIRCNGALCHVQIL